MRKWMAGVIIAVMVFGGCELEPTGERPTATSRPTATPVIDVPSWARPYLGNRLGRCDDFKWGKLLDATWQERSEDEIVALMIRDDCTEAEAIAIFDAFVERGQKQAVEAVAATLVATITPLPPADLEAVLRTDGVLKEIEDATIEIAQDRNYEAGELLYLCTKLDGWMADLEAGLAAGLRHEGDHGEAGMEEALTFLRDFAPICQ